MLTLDSSVLMMGWGLQMSWVEGLRGQVRGERCERWYAAHTQPHREARAAAQLQLQNFCVFLPVTTKTVRHARQFRTLRRPFFPRYLFVALDLREDPWRSVNGTFGVSRLVMAGDRPAAVPQGFVEDLISLSTCSGAVEFSPRLKVGQKVCVLSGPFAERIGELQRIDEGGRVRILLDLLGGKVPVWSEAGTMAPVA